MPTLQLKLKQASAVLRTDPKELQNLVQARVLRPKRRDGVYLFDVNMLLTALVGLYLKRVLGARTDVLAAYATVLAGRMDDFRKARPYSVVFTSRIPQQSLEVKVTVPFRKMAEELDERVRELPRFRDLPRGRKRPGWKEEFLSALQEAARDMGPVSEAEILETIRQYRQERRAKLEITVAAEA